MTKLRLGLLGENISYTLSPRIFDWVFRETGVDGEYSVFDLPADRARDFLMSGSAWSGMNVTTPHKTLAYELCAHHSGESLATRSVNTIVRTQNSEESWIEGFNTDVFGIGYALREMKTGDSPPRRVLVIGSGGAARAALLALSQDYPDARLEVASRDPHQAANRMDSLLRELSSHSCIDTDTASHFLRDFDMVIQATPVGSVTLPGCPLPEPLRFKTGAAVMDLIYAPRQTRFLEYAEQSGARIQNGIPMLMAQAAESFRIWTGTEFPMEKATENLLPELAAA